MRRQFIPQAGRGARGIGGRQLALGTLKSLHARAMFFDHMLAFLREKDASPGEVAA